jgi:hypothetical protein
MGKCSDCPKVIHHNGPCEKVECKPCKKKIIKKCFKCEIPCNENEKVKMLEVKCDKSCGYNNIYISTTFDPLKMARKCYVPAPTHTKYCCDFKHDIDSCSCEESSECSSMIKVVSCEKPRFPGQKHKKSKKHHHHHHHHGCKSCGNKKCKGC